MGTKFRFALSSMHRELVRQFKALNQQRTPGTWQIENMEFPEGDPDRAFMEFITAHASDLIKAIETNYWVE